MTDLRRLAEAAMARNPGVYIDIPASEYLKILDVVDKARTVTTARGLASTPKYGREAEAVAMEALRTALQALEGK